MVINQWFYSLQRRKSEWQKQKEEKIRLEQEIKEGFVFGMHIAFIGSCVICSGGPGLVALPEEQRNVILDGLIECWSHFSFLYIVINY